MDSTIDVVLVARSVAYNNVRWTPATLRARGECAALVSLLDADASGGSWPRPF
jgi:hypothetical protein